jgi:hypothetical protein
MIQQQAKTSWPQVDLLAVVCVQFFMLSKILPLLAMLLTLAGATPVVSAQTNVFSTERTYSQCQETWAFACNKRTADGRTYGTAHKRTHCSSYTFLPSGRAIIRFNGSIVDRGSYTVKTDKVRIKLIDSSGTVTNRFELKLSKDEHLLGDMSLSPTKPTK